MAKYSLSAEVADSIPVKLHSLAVALTMTVAISMCLLSLPYPGTVYRDHAVVISASQADVATEVNVGRPQDAGPGSTFSPLAGNGLLQFTSGGHVLGFEEKAVFIASRDHALKVEFVGGRPAIPHAQGKREMIASVRGGGSPLGKVTYPDAWDGVTVVYEGSPGAVVKSTYYIAPRTDQAGHTASPVDQIRLRYNAPVRLDDSGNLVMSFETGEMTESAPVAWQEVGGKRVPVDAAYFLLAEKEVGFRVGSHDPEAPLVIDPKLVWNTFMGSAGADDRGYGIVVDISGNIYVTGESDSTWGTPINGHAGGGASDAFAVKLNGSGVRIWHTFMGAADNFDTACGIAVDGGGNAYVLGYSSSTWGTPVNGYAGGTSDAFAARLDSSGARRTARGGEKTAKRGAPNL